MSIRKPHNDHAGYVAERRSGCILPDGRLGWVTIYDAPAAGLCDGAGRWTIVCQTHSTCIGVTSLRAGAVSCHQQACGLC